MFQRRRVLLSGSFAMSKKELILFFNKYRHFTKLYFILRLRKIGLPSITRINRIKRRYNKSNNPINCRFKFKRFRKRSIVNRFRFKRFKLYIRYQKFPRLKGVHFFIPSYYYVDFRTLRLVKTSMPNLKDIQHTFRGSLAKVSFFYNSQGF